jgi:large subunit ribosomal protein L11
MPKQTIESLVEGGKATAAPPLGPALGPLGVNIGQVVAEINKKTASFKGMQVPVKVIVDSDTKEFEVTVGTPPASSLIKKEAGLEKGASNPLTDKVADLKIEQIIKISKMKEGDLLGKELKNKIKEIMGTCQSMGVKVEGVDVPEALKQVDDGKFDKEIKEEKTELSTEELKEQEEEKKRLAEELEKKKSEFEKTAKEIMATMEGKEPGQIRSKLAEAKIPQPIIDELVPAEKKTEEGGEAKSKQ